MASYDRFWSLLVGVPAYEDAAIGDLPFIRADLDELAAALRTAGYRTRIHDLDRTSGDRLRDAVENFIDSADRGQTLLVYLSGHGVHHGGKDYLVPSNAQVGAHNFPGRCVAIDFNGHIERSNAGDVVVFVDACREGLSWGENKAVDGWSTRRPARARRRRAPYVEAWPPWQTARVRERRIAYVYACGASETARYVSSGADAFSLFSRALSHVLANRAGPLTLGQLRSAGQDEVDALAARFGQPTQRMRILSEDDPDSLEVCAGPRYSVPVWPPGDRPGAEPPAPDPRRVAEELPELAADLERLESTLRDASRRGGEAVYRFVDPGALYQLDDPDCLSAPGHGLRPWLADLRAAAGRGRDVDVAHGIRRWQALAAETRAVALRLVAANTAPWLRLSALRRRLDEARARAAEAGLAADATLVALHAQALAVLEAATVDLAAAGSQVEAYEKALDAHPGRGRAGPGPAGWEV